MEKNENIIIGSSNSINIIERKIINLSGVSKIESFDDEEFLMETNLGFLVVKGEGLEIVKLDTKEGIVSIKGLIISLAYVDQLKKHEKENGVFSKLFKWVLRFKLRPYFFVYYLVLSST